MPAYDVTYWLDQITLSTEELDKFHTAGDTVTGYYLDDVASEQEGLGAHKVNMFWANVGILKAALYGNPPKPMVVREFQDAEDDVARVAGSIIERLLKTGPGGSGADMHEAFQQSIEDRLIPGMGQIWFRYDAKVESSEQQGQVIERITDENVPCDYVHWKDFFYAPARFWSEVPWVARRVWMEKERMISRFGTQAEDIPLVVYQNGKGVVSSSEKKESLLRGEVYEIWCKTTRKVYWIAKGFDKMLDEREDPLQLRTFFPCPKPLLANKTNKKFIGRADYTMVQDQYQQLNNINIRINYLIEACKAVGVYDKTAEGVQRMLKQGVENDLIPIDNWMAFSEKGGIKGVVDWLPVEAIIVVIEKLRESRADTIQQIYELTGISDIMRGVTSPRETYGAQKLKAQYSSSRLQLYQQEVGEFVSEAYMIKACIMAQHFEPQTLLEKSLIMMTPDRQYAQEAVRLIKDKFQLMYRINVSSTQMSIPDYNAEKQQRQEYITVMGQFFGQAAPVLKEAPSAAPFMLRMLQWAGASFATSGGVETIFDNFIREVEKTLAQPKGDPEAARAQAEAQAKAMEVQTEAASKKELAMLDAQAKQALANITAGVQFQIAQLDNATKEHIAELDRETKLDVAGLAAGRRVLDGEDEIAERERDVEEREREIKRTREAAEMKVQHILDGAIMEVQSIADKHKVTVESAISQAETKRKISEAKNEPSGESKDDVTALKEMQKGLADSISEILGQLQARKSISITLPDGETATAEVVTKRSGDTE